jgi:carbonic anhydrase/acetyltransferase-like protein (isoleucine patch superfamily)
MRAYITSTRSLLEPFGDHPQDCLVGNRTLRDMQALALRKVGIEPVHVADAKAIQDSQPHLILEDRLFFTPELIAAFLARSRRLSTSTRCAIKPGLVATTASVPTQGVPSIAGGFVYELRYEPGQAHTEPTQVLIDPEQDFEPMPVSRHMCPDREPRLPVSDLLLVRIDHWVNLWAANLCVLIADLARLKKGKLRLMTLALQARSLNKWKVLRKTNVIGRGCDIHPTAYVEGSYIGDGSQIGAGAVVRSAIVGAQCRIMNRSTVEFGVLGEGAHIMNGCTAQFAVLYPGALQMSNLVSLSLCGRDSFIGDGATLTDFRFDRSPVKVLKNGAAVDTGIIFLGGCLGHGAYLGAGCLLAPGRAVPNGWRITRDTGLLNRFDPAGELNGFRVLTPAE